MEEGGDYYLMPLAMVGEVPGLLSQELKGVEQGEIKLADIYLPEDLPLEPELAADPT